MGLGNIIFNNFLAKIFSLALAGATWFYVFDIINNDSYSQKKETVEDVFSRYKFIVKELPVKPVYSGKSPAGYTVAFDKVKIVPSRISVFGPEDVLANLTELRTDKINIGEYTRSTHLRVGVDSDLKFLQMAGQVIDVYLPVEIAETEK
ncbi:MAG: YbbR-like domain-containing protein [Candidatus Omnitrophota bacterium]